MKVYIGYKNPRYDIREDIEPLSDAVTWASHNLALRHGIKLEGPYGERNRVYVVLSGEIPDNFNVGNHLRGISSYLMKNFPYIKQACYTPGQGLLYFIENKEKKK